jgi:hypothetical protein
MSVAARRLVSVRRATDAMLASASPRNPKLATRSSSASVPILLVAWRASASASSSRAMPKPSSLTRMTRMPPGFELHAHAAGARVETVLEELLQRRRGPIDDFAGGDLVDEKLGQHFDRRHAEL